jgi:excisionase family DNA binding protein
VLDRGYANFLEPRHGEVRRKPLLGTYVSEIISEILLSFRFVERDDFYTVAEAAKILNLTDRRIRQLMESGDLEATRSEGRWKVFRKSVHAFRDARHGPSTTREALEWPPEAREALRRAEELQRQLGRLEGEMKARLELTEVAESTLREQLERERQRADQEHREREQAQEEARTLRKELEEARRPWWRRWFS